MDKSVADKIQSYPDDAAEKLLYLRSVIQKVATENDLGAVEESLKWGEPSYRVKTGSPVRIDWKAESPGYCYIYFNCSTKLVDTFRELYADALDFQGNRAIVLTLSEKLPEKIISHCLQLALTYKKVKHLPLLGA